MKLIELRYVLASNNKKVKLDFMGEETVTTSLKDAYEKYGDKEICVIHNSSVATYENVDYMISIYK